MLSSQSDNVVIQGLYCGIDFEVISMSERAKRLRTQNVPNS